MLNVTNKPKTMKTVKEQFIEILNKRMSDAFNNPFHRFEYGRLLTAIRTIEELVPPECFQPVSQEK